MHWTYRYVAIEDINDRKKAESALRKAGFVIGDSKGNKIELELPNDGQSDSGVNAAQSALMAAGIRVANP